MVAQAHRRRTISLVLLSVLIPVSLLATFRMIGVLREPRAVDTKTIIVDPVYWNMTRPSQIVRVNQTIGSSYTSDNISLEFTVKIYEYYEDAAAFAFYGYPYADVIGFRVTGTANATQGYINSLTLNFSVADTLVVINPSMHPSWLKLNNLTIQDLQLWGTLDHEAYIVANSLDRPMNGSLSTHVWWMFFDENNTAHSTTLTLEIMHFDGTQYHKIQMPIKLGVFTH